MNTRTGLAPSSCTFHRLNRYYCTLLPTIVLSEGQKLGLENGDRESKIYQKENNFRCLPHYQVRSVYVLLVN